MRLPATRIHRNDKQRRLVVAAGIVIQLLMPTAAVLATQEKRPFLEPSRRYKCRAGYTRKSRRFMPHETIRAERKAERQRKK